MKAAKQHNGGAPPPRSPLLDQLMVISRSSALEEMASGNGLGLASARAFVQARQGTIGFDDAPSGGARFWFRLPAAEDTSR